MKQRVLFVDDDVNVLESFRRSLRDWRRHWEMHFVSSASVAWQRLQEESFDTVVSDVRMPGITGIELLERLHAMPATRDLPVIIVTGETDRGLKRQAIELGAADLLNKPIDCDDLVARLRAVLRLKSCQDELKQQNELLEAEVQRRTSQLAASRVDIIWRLGKAAEFRDEETGNHVIRVGCHSRTIAKRMGADEDFVQTTFLAAPLHDIGKIGIPDGILLKPGRLNDHEREIMQRHCAIGAAILEDDAKIMDVYRRWGGFGGNYDGLAQRNPILTMASEIAVSHHEKWDGSGYPARLSGEQIPLAARIVAICDVYDALRSERPYKPAFSLEKTLDILEDGAGRHFDPAVYAAFVASLDQILAVEAEFSDAKGAAKYEAELVEAIRP